MEMKISESNGAFKVTLKSLANQELTVYREISGGFTFELREKEEKEEINDVAFERVPLFKAEELKTVITQEDAFEKEETAQTVVLSAFFITRNSPFTSPSARLLKSPSSMACIIRMVSPSGLLTAVIIAFNACTNISQYPLKFATSI